MGLGKDFWNKFLKPIHGEVAELIDPLDLTGKKAREAGRKERTRLRTAEGTRQRNIESAVDRINATFAGYDEPYFQRVGQDVTAAQTPQLEGQFETARRNLLSQLSRGPGVTSSAGIRSLSDLTEKFLGGQTTIAQQAEEAQRKARESISGLQRSFTEQARGGADIGGERVAEELRLATQPPEFNPLADIFQEGAGLAATDIRARKQGFKGLPLTFNAGADSSSGTIVR